MHLRPDDLAIQHAGDEVVLLCLRTSTYFSANGSAAVLIEQLRQGDCEVDDLRRSLVDTFDADPDRAAADVDDFLLQLAAAGLLVTA